MTARKSAIILSKQPKKKSQVRMTRSKELALKETRGEFGPGRKEFIACSKCGAWYYDKSWHHALEDFGHLETKDKRILFKICPACGMIAQKTYEGAVIFENIPEKYLGELTRLIHRIGERAYKRDVLDRITDLKTRAAGKGFSNLEVYTSENQLAVSIANQVKRAFKKFKEKRGVRWSKEEDVARFSLNTLKSPERKRSTKVRRLVYYGEKYIEKK